MRSSKLVNSKSVRGMPKCYPLESEGLFMRDFRTLCRFGVLGSLLLFASANAQQPSVLGTPEAEEITSARTAIADHRWTLADGLLRRYLTRHPDAKDALTLLAMTLLRENRPKDSLLTYTQAARLATPSAEDLRYVALDYVLLHDYTDADRWITRSAQEDGSDGETWYAMGRIKYTENRFREAIESFERALALMPQSVKAENNLGLAYEGLNQPDDAVRAYRQAIAWQAGADHPSEQPLLNLGILLTDRNALDEAGSLLQQAEAIAPGNADVHAALGKLYARRSDLPQAQRELEQAVASKPDDAALHFQLGQVYRKEGLGAQAKQELARAATLDGTHSSDHGGVD